MVECNPQTAIPPGTHAPHRERLSPRNLVGVLVVALVLSSCSTSDTAASTTSPTATTGPSVVRDVGDCSARDLVIEDIPQPELPAEVAETRRALIEAAVACDFDRLSDLASAGEQPFLFGRNQEGDAGLYWREEELAGRGPLRFLVEILRRPKATVTRDTTEYRWPSVAGFTSWEDVPDAIRGTLDGLYDEEDFALFDTVGIYIGYRTAIAPDGEWLYLRGQG